MWVAAEPATPAIGGAVVPAERYGLERLPPRLARLVPLMLDGRSNGGIADVLCLALHTVENYVSEILLATACASRMEFLIRFRDWTQNK